MRPVGIWLIPWLIAWATALPARPAVLLANATGQAWRILPEGRRGSGTLVTVQRHWPGQPEQRFQLDFREAGLPEISLPPQATLAFSHGEPAGVEVRTWFGIQAETPAGAGPPVEGYLHFRTLPALLPLLGDRTGLAGAFYASGAPLPFHFAGDAGLRFLREGPEPAGLGCVVQ